ncbi:MAG: exodeoxyribonuclease V subunit gamma [Burkholderiaceae bacterium]
MLRILLDADTDAQAQRAIAWLAAAGGDPMAEDVLVVGQPASGYWLQHRLAAVTGISANLRIERPVGFLWRELANQLPGTSRVAPFDAMRVRWAIHAVLDRAMDEPVSQDAEHDLLIARWREAGAGERVLFATRLAHLFDGYQSYRRDWTDAWALGRDVASGRAARLAHEPWQRWLWGQVVARVKGVAREHPFERLRRERGAGETATPAQLSLFGASASVPDAGAKAMAGGRIVLFGALGLSPDQLLTVARLAQHRPMLWLATDPAVGFWQELVSPARAARLARDEPALHALFETEPALLGQWGRDHRDALAMMRELEQQGLAEIGESSLRERAVELAGVRPGNRLQRLQHAILALDDACWRTATDDDAHDPSLEIHVAHTLARQADVAYDRLMSAFDALPDLRADEVAVFCTDVDSAAPWLRARFEADPERALPIAVSGRSPRSEPGLAAVLDFLSMVVGELLPEVLLDWLDAEWARRRFGLVDGDLAALRRAFDLAGWRVDDLSAAQAHRHGWRSSIARLAVGACHDPTELDTLSSAAVVGELWPVAPGPDDALRALGGACAVVDEVRLWRSANAEQPIAHWLARLEDLCERWLGHDADLLPGLARLREATARLQEQAADAGVEALTLEALIAGLGEPLEQGARVAWPQGAITVAPWGGLRGVPYRVVVVIGLDDGAWPARPAMHEFDLMRMRPRFGDPSSGDRARAVMLDQLRDTRERLILCYAGRDPRDNGERPPSRVLGELTEYLRRVDPLWSACPCVHEHPLQSFSPRRFAAALPSYDRAWLGAARVLAGQARWPAIGAVTTTRGHEDAAPPTRVQSLTIDALGHLLRNPQRRYLSAALGVRLPAVDAELAAFEAFEIRDLDFRRRDRLASVVLDGRRRGLSEGQLERHLAGHPDAPPGLALAAVVRELAAGVDSLIAAERDCLAALGLAPGSEPPMAGAPLRVVVDAGHSVVGAVPAAWRVADGLVVVEPSPAAPAATLLDAWCRYLSWLAVADDDRPRSWLVPTAGGRRVLGWGPAAERLRGGAGSAGGAGAEDDGGPVSDGRASVPAADDDVRPDRIRAAAIAALGALVEAATTPSADVAHAFARLADEWLAAGGALELEVATVDDAAARKRVRTLYEGDARASRPGLIERPEVRAIWRAAPPPLDRALLASLACFGPVLASAEGRLPLAQAMHRFARAWSHGASR